MYPLRKNYLRGLLRDVGFQRIDTYGDFQETFADDEPDFFIHVAEKRYIPDAQLTEAYSSDVHTARDYYNSEDADNFYALVWGGEDIHVGTYARPDEDIATASRRTVERMAAQVDLSRGTRVLDIGSGFGGAARYLAATHGCHVTCLNLSERENERNRELTEQQGLSHLVEVVDGSFENLPFQDNGFDLIWSQDALLHSGDREHVLAEAARVLRPRGEIVFTDPMASDGCAREKLAPILERISLATMATPGFYREQLAGVGLTDVHFLDCTEHLPRHYQRVLDELEQREPELADAISEDYRTRMKAGLRNWIEGGNAGNLAWGIFHARA
jgi:sarcosine/dimethylglycine N-methyltransferase